MVGRRDNRFGNSSAFPDRSSPPCACLFDAADGDDLSAGPALDRGRTGRALFLRRHQAAPEQNLTTVAQTMEQRPSQEDAQPAMMRLQFVPEQPLLPAPTTRVRK